MTQFTFLNGNNNTTFVHLKILRIIGNLKKFKCGLRLGETFNPTCRVDSACKFAEEC